MKKLPYSLFCSMALLTSLFGQSIPVELRGTWLIQRELPTKTISCWGEKQAHKLVGTELEYSSEVFRWNGTVTKNPVAKTRILSAEQFRNENSGRGAESSQVDLRQLGIHQSTVEEISVLHPDASITGSTTEIPGDRVYFKDPNTIIFSVCNVYFSAKRVKRRSGH